MPLVRTGKAAFRFLIPTCVAENNPETASLVSHPDTLTIWFADDRRIVMYPCQNNEWLNFVCIYPDTDSLTVSNNGKKEACLDCFRDAHMLNTYKIGAGLRRAKRCRRYSTTSTTSSSPSSVKPTRRP